MKRYKNLGGGSGVAAYEIGPDYIKVQFSDGAIYRYTYASAGSSNVERMKQLAGDGQGLNAFIMANVREGYLQSE